MSILADDKYADRAWDWAKDFSHMVMPQFRNIFGKSYDAMNAGSLTPWSQGTFDFSKDAMAPYTGSDVTKTDIWGTLQNIYGPYMQNGNTNPFDSDLYKGIADLYDQTTEPLYAQMLDPAKRGIEGQYNNNINQMLASGVRGGALADMMSNAGMNRAQSLGDLEKTLRAQDLLRLDTVNQNRASALSDAAQNIAARNTQAGLMASNAMGQAGLGLRQQGLMANQYLSNLLSQLSGDDQKRVTDWITQGIQGRFGTGANLAAGESGSSASMFGGLSNMMSTLGMGLGMMGLGKANSGGASDWMSLIFDPVMSGGNIGQMSPWGTYGR